MRKKEVLKVNQISDKTKSSLKTRLVTAVVALGISIPCALLGDWFIFIFFFLLALFGSFEIVDLAKKKYSPWLYVVSAIICLLFFSWPIVRTLFVNNFKFEGHVYSLFSSGLVIPVILAFIGLSILLLMCVLNKEFTIKDAFCIFTLILFLGLGSQAIVYIRYVPNFLEFRPVDETGQTFINFYDNFKSSGLFCYVVIGALMTDIGAYFVGVFFGKHKINERISPNKTVEGFFGGIVISALSSFLFAFIFAMNGCPVFVTFDSSHWYLILILSLVLPFVSTLGDFVFSAIKREYGIKDFGKIFPGHGGVLDRLDSLTFAFITASLFIGLITNNLGALSW